MPLVGLWSSARGLCTNHSSSNTFPWTLPLLAQLQLNHILEILILLSKIDLLVVYLSSYPPASAGRALPEPILVGRATPTILVVVYVGLIHPEWISLEGRGPCSLALKAPSFIFEFTRSLSPVIDFQSSLERLHWLMDWGPSIRIIGGGPRVVYGDRGHPSLARDVQEGHHFAGYESLWSWRITLRLRCDVFSLIVSISISISIKGGLIHSIGHA